ncbi:5-hydroxytryptamine receptor 1-like, partial [Hetaerina americana]|uniref:5-hydroxytryptamine receptor 1-like n=1 Tax=Hetaerina americana TaxID=62018 RepID=UPI003A7F39FA
MGFNLTETSTGTASTFLDDSFPPSTAWTPTANSVPATQPAAPWFPGGDSTYSPAAAIIIALILLGVIAGTVVGNILVCVAVCLVRKLRRPCNYLLVSLAVSDLCVALLVMPMALLYEVLGRWSFGPVVCDLWVSFDVLSCTASILNLCAISVDRYLAITKPLEYGVKRTPRRMLCCVSLVWLGAACISLPPLLILGNEHGGVDENGNLAPLCIVCQNFGYQIYATLGSFYIPLTVMIVVYHKIFQAARKIVLEERRAQSHLKLTAAAATAAQDVAAPGLLTHHLLNPATTNQSSGQDSSSIGAGGAGGISNKASAVTELSRNGSATETRLSVGSVVTAWAPSTQRDRTSTTSTATTTSSCTGITPTVRCFGSRGRLGKGRRRRRSPPPRGSRSSPASSATPLQLHGAGEKQCLTGRGHEQQPMASVPLTARSPKLRFALAKERKASTTLGIIMSAFVICWLPFFVLALVRPFLHDPETIPASLSSLFLWLGYANSLLNPIIYATLNRDFRKPFQEILYFRCGSLNHMMREEFYHSQYGDPIHMTGAAAGGGSGGRYGRDEDGDGLRHRGTDESGVMLG